MTYTLIGTGNMAYFLAQRLQQAGFVCKGVWDRKQGKAAELAYALAATTITELSQLKDENDVCIIAVTDDAIETISNSLRLTVTTVIHTSGSQPLDILIQPNKAVLWPVYSIIKDALPLTRNFPVVCESSNIIAKGKAEKFAAALSDQIFHATADKRKWMHLIAAMGNNFTNHILAVCDALCKEQDIPFQIFLPIISQTFERIKTAHAIDLQSGAARRNDQKTIENHLHLLKEYPLWKEVYKKISASIKDMYSPKGDNNIG